MDTADPEVTASKRLAVELELARHKRRWTQQDLARRSGLSLTTVQSLENGRAGRPRKRTAVGLEEAFGWAEGSVDRILEGGRPVEGRDQPLAWSSLDEYLKLITDDEDAHQRLLGEVLQRITAIGRTHHHVIEAIASRERYDSAATPFNHLDHALDWQPGHAAAVARGAEFVQGIRGGQLAEFTRDGDKYPWKTAERDWLTPADELAITGSGLPEELQEFLARTISRRRREQYRAATQELDYLIRDLRRHPL